MPKDKKAPGKKREEAAGPPPPKLARSLPPTHIQKVGTQLQLEVVAEEEADREEVRTFPPFD